MIRLATNDRCKPGRGGDVSPGIIDMFMNQQVNLPAGKVAWLAGSVPASGDIDCPAMLRLPPVLSACPPGEWPSLPVLSGLEIIRVQRPPHSAHSPAARRSAMYLASWHPVRRAWAGYSGHVVEMFSGQGSGVTNQGSGESPPRSAAELPRLLDDHSILVQRP